MIDFRSKITGAKINLGDFLLKKPLPLILSWEQMKLQRLAKKRFLELREEKKVVGEKKKFVLHFFNQGASKKALVVHGWSSKSVYMIKLIQTLVDDGYEVIALDAPAHGESPGHIVSWEETVEAILETQKLFGKFDLSLGHSYGGAMLLSATVISNIYPKISGTFHAPKLVLLASPIRTMTSINSFARDLRLKDFERDLFAKKVRKSLGVDIDKFDGLLLQREFPTETEFLCVHDEVDSIIPFEDSVYFSKLGDHVDLHITKGLGHIDILHSDKVCDLIRDFSQR